VAVQSLMGSHHGATRLGVLVQAEARVQTFVR